MTTPMPATLFADPAPEERLERAATALTAHGFSAEILDDAAAARTRVRDLIPEGASVFTGASETLRLSGIDADINTSGRYDAVKTRSVALDRVRDLDEIWRLISTPDVIVGSVHAVTETGSLVIASASGSCPATPAAPPAPSGSSARRRWCPTWTPRCAASKSTASRWKTPALSRCTGSPAPSTTCSSSAQNPAPGAAPSCCSAKPSGSEPPGVAISQEKLCAQGGGRGRGAAMVIAALDVRIPARGSQVSA
jgi:hypothetical protein